VASLVVNAVARVVSVFTGQLCGQPCGQLLARAEATLGGKLCGQTSLYSAFWPAFGLSCGHPWWHVGSLGPSEASLCGRPHPSNNLLVPNDRCLPAFSLPRLLLGLTLVLSFSTLLATRSAHVFTAHSFSLSPPFLPPDLRMCPMLTLWQPSRRCVCASGPLLLSHSVQLWREPRHPARVVGISPREDGDDRRHCVQVLSRAPQGDQVGALLPSHGEESREVVP